MSKGGTPSRCAGVVATACTQGKRTQHGRPRGVVRDDQPDAREGQAGRPGESERFIVPMKPGNAGGGKGPQFKTNAIRSEGPGKLRPLGISTLGDRVCMTAAMLVLEPIFEADLPPEQYAYRPGRNAQQAVVEVDKQLYQGHREVVDADLADYFGSIPHSDLLKSVARRIVDRRVLHLSRCGWNAPLKKPMIEEGRHARPRLGTTGTAFRKGHPSHRCWRISTCAGSCWDGRCSGWSEASALAS